MRRLLVIGGWLAAATLAVAVALALLGVVAWFPVPRPVRFPDRQAVAAFGLGFWVAVGLGHLVVGRCLHPCIYGRIKREYPDDAREDEREEPPGRWMAATIGVVETSAYFLLLIFDVPGAGAFIVGWIALKMATGWNRLTSPRRYYRRMSMAALVLNLVNVLFGVSGALLFHWLS